MPETNLKVKNNSREMESATALVSGINRFQDEQFIKATDLTDAKNVEFSADAIIPRHGTAHFITGTDSDTASYGGIQFRKSDGTSQTLRISGGKLKKVNGQAWATIGSTSFSSILATLIQIRDKVYIHNGTDNLGIYDGSTITSMAALPSLTGLAVTPTGTTGSTTYKYQVSAFNDYGESIPCAIVTTTTGNATLSSTNYNKLDWNAVAGATGYNIWGRKATGTGICFMATVITNTYNDTGADTPDVNLLPPEGDSTAGIKGKYAIFAISRMFVAGDPSNPSRLYWGGTSDNVANFSFDIKGGGYVDIYKNDGAEIKAIIPYQAGVIVGKDNAIYKVTFVEASDGSTAVKVEEITRSFGIVSHYGSKAVENDVVFPSLKDGRLAFYALGNQENYSSSVLRTNELSIKPSPMMENVEVSRLPYCAAFYFRNIYGCAVSKEGSSTNDRIWVLDTRLGAWAYWEGIDASYFFDNKEGSSVDLLFGSVANGYLWKAFTDDRNDNDVAIEGLIATKAFAQDIPVRYKHYYTPAFQFKGINQAGAINIDVYLDGVEFVNSFAVTTSSSQGAGVGAMLWGVTLAGEASGGTPADTSQADQLAEIYDPDLEARSIKYYIRWNSKNLNFSFIGLYHEYIIQKDRPSGAAVIYG